MAETTRTTAADFGREVVEQVKKVTWPSVEELRESTGIIVVFVLLVAAVIWAMDLFVSRALDLFIGLFT